MKKTLLTLLAVLLLSITAYTQEFYFTAGLGLAFPQAGQTMSGTRTPYNGSSNSFTYPETFQIKAASFSAGYHGKIGMGYMFSEHIGIQLDADAGFHMKKYTYRENDVYIITNKTVGPLLSDYVITQQASIPVMLLPSLVLQSSTKKLNVYSRLGMALPLHTSIKKDDLVINLASSTNPLITHDFKWEVKNSFSLGFTAAGGVHYRVSNRLSIYGEVSLLSMSLFIKERDLTGFVYNGQSQSLSHVTSPHTFYYSKNTTADSLGINQPTYSQPFSNIGINVGINLSMTTHSRHSTTEGDKTKKIQ